MSDFHISKLPDVDIQRSYMYKVFVPKIAEITDGDLTPDEFVLRCTNAIIPSRANEPIETFYLGMKKTFPGKPTMENTAVLMLNEFEDQKILKGLYKWQEKVFSISNKNKFAGGTGSPNYRSDVIVRMYKQTEGEEMDKAIQFYGAWPTNVDEVALDYESQEQVKYSLTLSYHYWDLV